MTLGERIKKRRLELGLSQSELADLLNYGDRSTIAKIESGKNDLTQSKIFLFASKLETTVEYLMGWTDDPYDYDLDPNSIFSEIPSDTLRHLQDAYNNNNAQIWKAWKDMNENSKIDDTHATLTLPHTNRKLLELDQTYLRLAQGAQELGLDDDDIDQILAIYKKHKQRNAE